MTKILEARVRQKADTIENLMNNDLPLLDGEQVFVRSDVDGGVMGFKIATEGKKFSELPYPDLTVRGKVSPTSSWAGRQSGVYIPTTNGTYNGVTVNLTEGYQVLYWDGATIEKVVYPAEYNTAVFGGVIDSTEDLSTPPVVSTWYIASAGTYNTVPETILTETSILSWDGSTWSNIPFELEIRGEFLVADNIQEVRNITPEVAQLLVNGTYKGVEVLGYYQPGDTPAPINYYVSDTTEEDDGGAVFEVGGIKLEHDFNYWVDVKYYGVRGNNTDETSKIQNALNRAIGGTLYVSKPLSNYLTGQILVPSDTNIQLDPNTKWNAVDTLIQTANSFEGLFRFVNSENCIIQANDSVFEMNKSAYSSEHNHIFIFDSCDNISVYNAVANSSGGDGFYITGLNGSSIIVPKGNRNHSSNIHLVKCRADNNRRNGLSIVGGYNITVDDCVFTGSSGTSIQSGVDIEPEFRTDRSNNIYFNRCKFNDNAGRGSLINLQRFTNNQDPEIEIIYTDCIASTNGQHGFGTQLSQGVKGSVKYIRCISQENFYCGYLEISSTPDLVKEYHDCLAINNNTSNSTNPIYSYGASWYIHYSETLDVPKVGGTKLYRCKSIDTRGTSTIRRAIGLRYADDKPEILPENIYIEDFTSVGHSIEELSMVSGCKNVNRIQTSETKVVSIPDSANIQGISLGLIGYEINNQGSTATIRVQLPIANEGYTFKFTVKTAQGFTIIPQTGKFINGLMRSSSSLVTSNVVGSTITLKGLDNGNWEVINIFGNWSSYQTWSTELRPTAPKTGESGYNSTLQFFEYYNGTAWVQLASNANATTTVKGLVNQAVAVPNGSSVDDVLQALRDAGLMAT